MGKMSTGKGIAILAGVILVLGGVWIAFDKGLIGTQNNLVGPQQTYNTNQNTNPGQTIVTTSPCGDDQQANFEARYKNVLYTGTTASSIYPAAPVSYVKADGTIVNMLSVAASSSYSSSSNALECGGSYKAVVLSNGTATVSAETGYQTVNAPFVRFDIEGAKGTQPCYKVYTLAYANDTTSGVCTVDNTTGTNNALDQGSTLDLRFDVTTVSGTAQFGSAQPFTESDTGVSGQAFVCADFNLAKYALSDVIINYPGVIRELTVLPKWCSANGYEKAWEVKPVKSSDGTVSGTFHIAATVGAPADADNVAFAWVDNCAYQGNNGKVKYGTADDGNADVCATNTKITIDNT